MRLIDADALWMEIIHRMDYCDDILEIIESMPTIEPERKNGKWIDDEGNAVTDKYCATCSVCGKWSEYLTAYCPNCGAKMEEG